jgi:hypothetical protein
MARKISMHEFTESERYIEHMQNYVRYYGKNGVMIKKHPYELSTRSSFPRNSTLEGARKNLTNSTEGLKKVYVPHIKIPVEFL